MKEYIVHYMDAADGKVKPFYFLDYKNFQGLMKDLRDMDFEGTYGEIVDLERVIIDEYVVEAAQSA